MSASNAPRTRRRIGALVAAVAISAVLVLGPAATAQAAIWPKGFNPKQYMLNVLGSVLAGSSPDGKLGNVKRAVISADQQYDHSWEGLNELWKKDSPKNIPGSYEDYVIQKQEYFQEKGIKGIQGQKGTPENTGKGTKYVKPMKAPATKAKKFIRAGVGVGIGVGSVYGWDHRAEIGSAVGGLFGVDSAGAYCSDRDDLGNLTAATDFITGIDCSAYQTDDSFQPNTDAVGGYTMGKTCYPGYEVACINSYDGLNNDGFSIYACFSGTKEASSNFGLIATQQRNGAEREVGGLIGPTGSIKDTNGKEICGNHFTTTVVNVGYATQDEFTRQYGLITPKCIVPMNLGIGTCEDAAKKGYGGQMTPVASDPDRSFICTYQLADGTTQEKESETFKETDGDVPSPVCPALDAGSPAVTGVDVDEVNKADGTRQSVYEADTTGEYQDWFTKYPECREGACALDLVLNSKSKSCFADAAMNDACMDWMTDPDKAQNYQCWYGGHKVDLSECYVYGDVFNPEKVLQGSAYTDPTTGASLDGQSSPTAAKKVLARGITDPQDFTGCLDTGWAKVNPVEWVMTPIVCSLQWAFAPSPVTAVVEGNKVENAWNDKPPGQIASAAAGWKFAPKATGCRLIANLELPLPGGKVDHAPVGIDACDGPIAQYAGMVKTGLGVILGVLSFLACRRVAAGFAGAESTVSNS